MQIVPSALLCLVWTSTSVAFTVAPRHAVVSRSSLVDTRQLQVALSDPNVVANAEGEDQAAASELEVPLTTEDVVAAIGSDEPVFASSPSEEENEGCKLYVGNLPFTATEAQVRQLFENADVPVVEVSLPTNPYRVNEETGSPFSKGFAFVTLASEELVEKGINSLNDQNFEGRALRVNKMLPKEELEKTPKRNRTRLDMEGRKKLYVGNLPFSVTKDDIKNFLGEYGELHDVFIPMRDGEPRGFAFVTMDGENADMAIRETNGVEFMGRPLVVSESIDKNDKVQKNRQRQLKIYVGNLAFSTTRETLQGVFEEFGDVYDCYVPMDPNTMNPRGFAFVTMNVENGEDAIAELDGLELDGRFIRVNEAQGKKKPAGNNNEGGWYNDRGNNYNNDSGEF